MKMMCVFYAAVVFLFAGSLCGAAEDEVSSDLFTKKYRVSPFLYAPGNQRSYEAESEPISDVRPLRRGNPAPKFFEDRGVFFGPGANALIGKEGLSSLIVRNTTLELAKIEAIIERRHELLAPRIINVIVEFIEVDEGLYHDWMFENRLNKPGRVFRRQVQEWVNSGEARVSETMIVASRSGQRAKTQSVSEMIYPSEPGVPGTPKVVLLEGRKSPAPLEGAVPSAFETRNVGATLEVDPVLGNDNVTVDLSLAPELVESLGVIDWPPQSDDPFFTISLPRFYTVKVSTQVTLLSRGYALLGVGRVNERKGERPMVLMFARADVARIPGFGKLESTRNEK